MENPKLDLQLSEAEFGKSPDAPVIAADQTSFWSVEAEALQPGVSDRGPGAPSTSFIQEIHVKAPSSSAPWKMVGVVVGILIGGFGVLYFVTGQSPLELIAHMFGSDRHVAEAPMTRPKARKPEITSVTPAPEKVIPTPGLTSQAPYSLLPNILMSDAAKRAPAMNAEEGEALREGLESSDYYARYKAILDIIAARREGSEEPLRAAVQGGKFWMRMHAVIGLADLGYKVSNDDVQMALGDAHSELRSRFFDRFMIEGRCTSGCYFVLRSAMKYLDAPGRLSAMKVISTEASESSVMFVVAGLFDQDAKIRQYANDLLLRAPVDTALWWKTFEIIFGQPSENNARVTYDTSAAPTHFDANKAGAATAKQASQATPAGSAKTGPSEVVAAGSVASEIQDANGESTQRSIAPLEYMKPSGAVIKTKMPANTEHLQSSVPAVSPEAFSFAGGVGLTFVLLSLLGSLITVIAFGKLFAMAGESWWAVLIPFYNMFIITKIAKVSPAVLIGLFIPLINMFMGPFVLFKFAKAYREEDVFCLLVAIFSPIMVPVMAFSNETRFLADARTAPPIVVRPGVPGTNPAIPFNAA